MPKPKPRHGRGWQLVARNAPANKRDARRHQKGKPVASGEPTRTGKHTSTRRAPAITLHPESLVTAGGAEQFRKCWRPPPLSFRENRADDAPFAQSTSPALWARSGKEGRRGWMTPGAVGPGRALSH